MPTAPFLFGAKIAATVDWKNILSGAGAGGAVGATLGGLHGLVAPGTEPEYDDEGNVIGTQQRGRFGAALRGALGGGLVGGGLGAGLNHLRPNATTDIYNFGRRTLTGKTQNQLNEADNLRRAEPEQRALHAFFKTRQDSFKKNPIRLPPPKYTPPAYPRMELEPEAWETAHTMTPDEIAHSEDANL